MILKIENLTSGYYSVPVIKNINLEISEGEIIGILGPNGAGKSTLFKNVLRIIKPFNGYIYYKGKNVFEIPNKEYAQNVSAVFPFLNRINMTVKDFLLLARIPHFKRFQFFETKKDEEIVEYYLKITGIYKLKNKFLTQLSAGELQMAIIAKALSQQSKLLLLDEPVSHLDIHHQVKVLNILKEINKLNSLTMLIILHDLNLASEYCDRIVLMKSGKIIKEGKPSEVIKKDIIESVYETDVIVEKNNLTGNPNIFLAGYKN